MSKKQKRKR